MTTEERFAKERKNWKKIVKFLKHLKSQPPPENIEKALRDMCKGFPKWWQPPPDWIPYPDFKFPNRWKPSTKWKYLPNWIPPKWWVAADDWIPPKGWKHMKDWIPHKEWKPPKDWKPPLDWKHLKNWVPPEDWRPPKDWKPPADWKLPKDRPSSKQMLPWMVGGMGTALHKNRANSKPINLDHLKCPTFKEAKRVSQ